MATRKKKVIITGVSREAADEAVATYAKSDARPRKSGRLIRCRHSRRSMRKNSFRRRNRSTWLMVPSVSAPGRRS